MQFNDLIIFKNNKLMEGEASKGKHQRSSPARQTNINQKARIQQER